MMNKKAVDENIIKELILAVVILIILLVLFSGITHILPGVAEDTECSSYVKLVSTLKSPVTKQTRIDLSKTCPTEKLEIKPKGKTEDDKKNNALDSILAEMYYCAKKFGFEYGEVKYNPFSQWQTDNVCVVCSDVTFSNFAGNKYPDLLLRSTEAKIPIKGSDDTYYEYFTGNEPSEEIRQKFREFKIDGNPFLIDTNEKYYIVYSIDMSTTTQGFLTRLISGAAAGGAVGGTALVASTPVTLPLTIGLKLIGASFPAGKILLGFTLAGGLAGGVIGTQVRDESTAHLFKESLLFITPQTELPQPKTKTDPIHSYCKTLGTNPFPDPWEGEVLK